MMILNAVEHCIYVIRQDFYCSGFWQVRVRETVHALIFGWFYIVVSYLNCKLNEVLSDIQKTESFRFHLQAACGLSVWVLIRYSLFFLFIIYLM